MPKGAYFGVGSKARKIRRIYVGIGGKARKVKKGYIGIGGKARKFFGGEVKYYKKTTSSVMSVSINSLGINFGNYALFAGGRPSLSSSNALEGVYAFNTSLIVNKLENLLDIDEGLSSQPFGGVVGNYALISDMRRTFQTYNNSLVKSTTVSYPRNDASNMGNILNGVATNGTKMIVGAGSIRVNGVYKTSSEVAGIDSSLVKTTLNATGENLGFVPDDYGAGSAVGSYLLLAYNYNDVSKVTVYNNSYVRTHQLSLDTTSMTSGRITPPISGKLSNAAIFGISDNYSGSYVGTINSFDSSLVRKSNSTGRFYYRGDTVTGSHSDFVLITGGETSSTDDRKESTRVFAIDSSLVMFETSSLQGEKTATYAVVQTSEGACVGDYIIFYGGMEYATAGGNPVTRVLNIYEVG